MSPSAITGRGCAGRGRVGRGAPATRAKMLRPISIMSETTAIAVGSMPAPAP
jgi:hypothetical protein